MKHSHILYYSVIIPNVAFAVWKIQASVGIAALGAIGFACSSGQLPACVAAGVASIIITAMTAINGGQDSGENGASTVRRNLPPVAHHLPNGTVHDYLNTAALEVGKWHLVQTGVHTLSASKHPDGYNMIRADLTADRDDKLSKRADANAIDSVQAQFGDRNWPVANKWSQEEIDAMADSIILHEDDGFPVSLCSTISDDTDADKFDMSWIFETPNRIVTSVPPPCAYSG